VARKRASNPERTAGGALLPEAGEVTLGGRRLRSGARGRGAPGAHETPLGRRSACQAHVMAASLSNP
jgi:hypothetical protein